MADKSVNDKPKDNLAERLLSALGRLPDAISARLQDVLGSRTPEMASGSVSPAGETSGRGAGLAGQFYSGFVDLLPIWRRTLEREDRAANPISDPNRPDWSPTAFKPTESDFGQGRAWEGVFSRYSQRSRSSVPSGPASFGSFAAFDSSHRTSYGFQQHPTAVGSHTPGGPGGASFGNPHSNAAAQWMANFGWASYKAMASPISAVGSWAQSAAGAVRSAAYRAHGYGRYYAGGIPNAASWFGGHAYNAMAAGAGGIGNLASAFWTGNLGNLARGAMYSAYGHARYYGGMAAAHLAPHLYTAHGHARYWAGRAGQAYNRQSQFSTFAAAAHKYQAGQRAYHRAGGGRAGVNAMWSRTRRSRSNRLGSGANFAATALANLAGTATLATRSLAPISAGIGTAYDTLNRIRIFAEERNDQNRRYGAFNPNIGLGFAHLAMSDVQRNMTIGRQNQDSILRLTSSIDRMRSSFLDYDSFMTGVGTRLGSMGSETVGSLGRMISPIFKDWQKHMEIVDPGGAASEAFGQNIWRNVHGGLGAAWDLVKQGTAVFGGMGPIFGKPQGIGNAFNANWEKEAKAQADKLKPNSDAWIQSLREMVPPPRAMIPHRNVPPPRRRP